MTTTPEDLQPLTKISANFVPHAVRALEIASEITGDTRTDTLNRAVQLYAYVEKLRHDGGRLLLEEADGTVRVLDIA